MAARRAGLAGFWQRSPAGTLTIATLWLVTLALAGAIAAEWLLQRRAALNDVVTGPPRVAALYQAYRPFQSLHLHPQYLFFFPPTAAARLRLANATCSIDQDAFREPGPRHADGRKLAFLIGGSVAFGWYASSNEQTITSHLNRLQSEYFFVNAGAPGFTSTQELIRLTYQIADFQPALVVAFGGWNDLSAAVEPGAIARHYAPGTPWQFGELEDAVAAAQAPRKLWRPADSFPELLLRLNALQERDPSPPDSAELERAVEQAAARYSTNQLRMADFSRSIGARFISVFQPLAALHRGVPSTFERDEIEKLVGDRYHRLATAHPPGRFESLDLGRLFDGEFSEIPVMGGDVEDDTIFIDNGHLYDPGNAIVARHLARLIVANGAVTTLVRP